MLISYQNLSVAIQGKNNNNNNMMRKATWHKNLEHTIYKSINTQ